MRVRESYSTRWEFQDDSDYDRIAEPDHWSESGGRMRFHALGSFAVIEQSERRLPPLRSVLSLGIIEVPLD